MNGYGFLRQPRWLALGFLVLVIVPSFFALSRWQLNRLDQRRYENALVLGHSSQTPQPLDNVMKAGSPNTSVGDPQRWVPVIATGTYDSSHQQLVRKRPLDGSNGFWVTTPLVTTSGAVVVVNRGWIAAAGGATAVQDVPPPPSGVVTVTGRVQPSEDGPHPQPADLPAGQITDLDISLFASPAAAIYPGSVELISSVPAQPAGLTPLPEPDLSDGPHLGYALQWILFAIIAVGGFVMLARREREYSSEDDNADPALEESGASPSDVG